MKCNEIALRPSYWASVSGGKDSLYMLNYIMHNLDKYPRVLENYCRNDILLTFEFACRQAGKLIAKGELKDDNN